MKPNNIYIYLYYYYFNNFFGCIALGWLCIVMLLHKEIESLKSTRIVCYHTLNWHG